jgi:diadenosine tetraphosphate (Ap4A) HIT family hydrolase
MVVPRAHVVDAISQPIITGAMFAYGAQYLRDTWKFHGHGWNMTTNIGPDAGQTAPHLHVHLVPREAGDDFCMPWRCHERGEVKR